MRDDDAPHFGQSANATNQLRDEINDSMNQLFGTAAAPATITGKTKAQPVVDELDSAMLMPVEGEDQKRPPVPFDKRKSLGGEQFEKMVTQQTGKMPSMIHHNTGEDGESAMGDQTREQIGSSFFNGVSGGLNNFGSNNTAGHNVSASFVFLPDEVNFMNKEGVDEYADDDDPGFDMYVVNEENFVVSCKELA